MFFYAQLNNSDICVAISSLSGEVDQQNMIALTAEQYQSSDCLRKRYDWATNAFVDVPPVSTWVITRNAFQNRFPITSNGISTKYDLMTLFLNDVGYANSLGVTGSDLYSQRALITTGNNRLNITSGIDLQDQAAIDYVNMMTNSIFPEVFRLTTAEANTILTTPAAANEKT